MQPPGAMLLFLAPTRLLDAAAAPRQERARPNLHRRPACREREAEPPSPSLTPRERRLNGASRREREDSAPVRRPPPHKRPYVGVSQGTVLGFGDGFGAILWETVAKSGQTCQELTLKYPHEEPCVVTPASPSAATPRPTQPFPTIAVRPTERAKTQRRLEPSAGGPLMPSSPSGPSRPCGPTGPLHTHTQEHTVSNCHQLSAIISNTASACADYGVQQE